MAGHRQRWRGLGLWQVEQRGPRFLWHIMTGGILVTGLVLVDVIGWSRCQSLEAGSELLKAAFVDLDARSTKVLGMDDDNGIVVVALLMGFDLLYIHIFKTSAVYRKHRDGITHQPADA